MAGRSLNRVLIIGNLTRDPELRYTPNGTAVCTFGVATNRTWTTATGESKDSVQFHRVVAWQKLAELCGKLLSKGRKVYVEGRLTYQTFTGRDGLQKNLTEIVADDFILFDDRYKHEQEGGETHPETAEMTPEATDITDENTDSDIDEPVNESQGEVKKDNKTKTAPDKSEDSEDIVDPDDIPF